MRPEGINPTPTAFRIVCALRLRATARAWKNRQSHRRPAGNVTGAGRFFNLQIMGFDPLIDGLSGAG
jgi:hypothetical protein